MDQELKELLLSMQGEIKALRDNMNARFDKSDERMTKMEIHQENEYEARFDRCQTTCYENGNPPRERDR